MSQENLEIFTMELFNLYNQYEIVSNAIQNEKQLENANDVLAGELKKSGIDVRKFIREGRVYLLIEPEMDLIKIHQILDKELKYITEGPYYLSPLNSKSSSEYLTFFIENGKIGGSMLPYQLDPAI